jgi:hypothetical protein
MITDAEMEDLTGIFSDASMSSKAKIERMLELWQELTGETELPLPERVKHWLLLVGRMCSCPQCGSIVETKRIQK